MDKKGLTQETESIENKLNVKFPPKYTNFLLSMEDGEIYEISDTGISLYPISYLLERNNTYEVQEYEPEFILIAQEGDLAFFVKSNEESVYSNDLGALGSLGMTFEADDIDLFIEKYK